MVSALVHSWQSPSGDARLGVLVKRAYRLEPGRRVSPLATAPPIHLEQVTGPADDAGDAPLLHESDLTAFERASCDVLLQGAAYARGARRTMVDTGLSVGPARKMVRVWGDRAIRTGRDGAIGTTEAEAFDRMPLEWSRAYGGRDRYAERALRSRGIPAGRTGGLGASEADGPTSREIVAHFLGSLAYPRNRFGCGFALDLDRGRIEGSPMPNLEDPEDPVTPDRLLARDDLDWIDRPVAACYGPVDALTFPRCLHGPLRPDWAAPTRLIHEISQGALRPDDLAELPLLSPPRASLFNAAPAGLSGYQLAGNEPIRLWNVHPLHETVEADLPSERPRIQLEPPGAGQRDLQPVLREVLLEPDDDRVTLTWTAAMTVAAVFPEAMCRTMAHTVRWER